MIVGHIQKGNGLGNSLHRYVMTRVLALDKGFHFGFIGQENFKGSSFMRLSWGNTPQWTKEFNEKRVNDTDRITDIRSYDPNINFVEDGTRIDGEFQDERYFEHRLPLIRQWLEVKPLEMPDDLCVINFRGGEFSIFPELFLTTEYWEQAIKLMQDKYLNIKAFQVHTDDPILAKQFFPEMEIVQDIGFNWRSIRYAKYLILSNSSFAILPALLNENVKEIIAPKYWARRNTKVWALPQNYYKKFTYI